MDERYIFGVVDLLLFILFLPTRIEFKICLWTCIKKFFFFYDYFIFVLILEIDLTESFCMQANFEVEMRWQK